MSGPSLELEMRMKDGRVAVGLDALAAKEEKVEQGLGKIGRGAKQAEAELARFAKRTTDINATPLEKYQRQVERLDQSLRKGLISQETYTRAVARARTEHERTSAVVSRAVGKEASSAIDGLAAKWLSVHTAVNLATQAVQEHAAKVEAARNRLKELADLRMELGQVGGPELANRATSLTQYGLTEREALEFTLNAQNLNFLDDLEVLAANKAGIGDLRKVADVAGMAPMLLGGKVTPKEAVNMTFAAANPSRLSPGQMAPIVARFAMGAEQQGTDADEVFALASVLAQKMPSPETAAQYTGSFQTKLSISKDERLGGKGMIGAVEALQNMPAADREEFLKKDVETNALFQIITQSMDEIKQRKAEVRAARLAASSPNSLMAEATRRNLANPQIAAALKDTAAEETRRQAEEARYGVGAADANAAANALLARMEANNVAPWAIKSASMSMGFAKDWLGIRDPRTVQTFGNLGGLAGSTGIVSVVRGDPGSVGRAAGQASADLTKDGAAILHALGEQTAVLKQIEAAQGGRAGAAVMRDALAPLQ